MARRRPPAGSERLDAPRGLRWQLAKAERDVERFCHGVCTHPVTPKNPPDCDHRNEMMCLHGRKRVVSLRRMIAEEEARVGSA